MQYSRFILALLLLLWQAEPGRAQTQNASGKGVTAQSDQDFAAVVLKSRGHVDLNGKPHNFSVGEGLAGGALLACKDDGVLDFKYKGGKIVHLTVHNSPYEIPYVHPHDYPAGGRTAQVGTREPWLIGATSKKAKMAATATATAGKHEKKMAAKASSGAMQGMKGSKADK